MNVPLKQKGALSNVDSTDGQQNSSINSVHVKNDPEAKGSGQNSSLTLEQKKENHIMSENRRRALIRASFDDLVKHVPQLDESESRSEYAILIKTTNYIEHLRSENERLEKLRLERNL